MLSNYCASKSIEFQIDAILSKNTLFRKGAPKGPESLECNATDTSSPKDFVQKVLERHFSLYAWATGGVGRRRGERATREKFENFLRLPKKELLLLHPVD